jgi:hypothetical protein
MHKGYPDTGFGQAILCIAVGVMLNDLLWFETRKMAGFVGLDVYGLGSAKTR